MGDRTVAQATRRTEVDRLHRQGFTVPQIATALGITRQAVHYHLRKLGHHTTKATT